MSRSGFSAIVRALALAALATLGACEADASKPVEPHWGKVPCGHCAMLVSTPRYAAQGVRASGERVFFDDVGCLVSFEHSQREPLRIAWAHDEASGWHDMQTARFRSGESTPMDFGFAAVSSAEGASITEVRGAVLAKIAHQEALAP